MHMTCQAYNNIRQKTKQKTEVKKTAVATRCGSDIEHITKLYIVTNWWKTTPLPTTI